MAAPKCTTPLPRTDKVADGYRLDPGIAASLRRPARTDLSAAELLEVAQLQAILDATRTRGVCM